MPDHFEIIRLLDEIAAIENDLVALQFQVAVHGTGHHLQGGDQ